MTTLRAVLSKRSEPLHPLRPFRHLPCTRMALLLSVAFFAGLAGCGPPSPDNAQSQESRASVAGLPSPHKNLSPRNYPAPPITNLVPSAEANGTGSASDTVSVPSVNIKGSGGEFQTQPVDTPNGKSVPLIPNSITKDLNSADANVRLQALNHWGSKGTTVPLEPLFEAVDDEDPAVRAKAIEIIERYWAAEQERERG